MKLKTFGLVHRGKIHCFFVGSLVRRCLCIDIADQRQLRQKLVHVFELACEHGELIQIFAAQFVISESHFRIVIVDRFHDGGNHV